MTALSGACAGDVDVPAPLDSWLAPPRWARHAATAAVLTTVPSALWRMAMALGVPVGVDSTYRSEHYGFTRWGTAYVLDGVERIVLVACYTGFCSGDRCSAR